MDNSASIARMSHLDKDKLNSIFNYNHETGELTYKKQRGPMKSGMLAGTLSNNGYINLIINYKFHLAHRVIMTMINGDISGKFVDHINGIKTDNRIENLRLCTHQQNMWNSVATKRNNTGVKGVFLNKITGLYMPNIRHNGKIIYLGSFKNLEDAKAVRVEAELKYHGKFSKKFENIEDK